MGAITGFALARKKLSELIFLVQRERESALDPPLGQMLPCGCRGGVFAGEQYWGPVCEYGSDKPATLLLRRQ